MNLSRKVWGGEQEEEGEGDVQPSLTCKELNMPLITLVAILRFSLARSAQISSLSRSSFYPSRSLRPLPLYCEMHKITVSARRNATMRNHHVSSHHESMKPTADL